MSHTVCHTVTGTVTHAERPVSVTPTRPDQEVLTGDRRLWYREWGVVFMTVDQKAQVRNAREEKPMSSENDEQNSAEVDLRTPEEWCQIERVQILDADGWRGRDGRDWTDAISQAEFQERLATCTQRSIPLQESPITGPQYPLAQHSPGVTIGGGASGPWPAGAPILATIPTTQPAGEQHTGTLNLTGDGNPEPEPIRSVIDHLTEAARRVNWKPDDKHPLQARYDALRSLMSIYAYATLVSLETLQRTDPGAADRVAEHLNHDDWDVRAECALLWHESLTGGARYAPFDEELHLLAGHHDPTEAATRLGRELGRREALDRESMIDALEAEWLRNSKQKTVGSPRSFCTRLADALIAAREIANKAKGAGHGQEGA